MFGRKKVSIPEEYQRFNQFSADKERLLCIGAFTTECKHKVETKLDGSNKMLKLYYPKNQAAKVMKYWLPMFGINDGYSAVEVITNWIQANDYSGMIAANTTNKVIRIVTKASQKEGLDETSLVAAANKVKTYGAFDLDRLGYIVRVCYSLDLINEEQAWDFFEELWGAATMHFDDWDEYCVSYLNGEEGLDTNWYSDGVKAYVALRKDPASLLNKYQLKN
ncbi:DUF1266 domain-containing protein [Listeria monocytogenes]|nr:DUF1266 domain-containing protein [Listeria monocytogenes]EIJ3195847.1 DUF1266 domain-containing protein [Listeria monocytogenes]EJE4626753.1 DUF1266 domain-containing protein [Listeria monocytogenes]MDD28262.1 DUF1266 domain-containing protein [Listeria monocytogenes]